MSQILARLQFLIIPPLLQILHNAFLIKFIIF